jgi:antitoxin (DNA-binding transcriptional repressor) of toxin-antitoxin stability system
MVMRLSLTKVRSDLYKIVDRVLETGVPVEIERHGRKVRIVPVRPKSKLDNLVWRPGTIVGDADDIVHMDWSGEWTEGRNR